MRATSQQLLVPAAFLAACGRFGYTVEPPDAPGADHVALDARADIATDDGAADGGIDAFDAMDVMRRPDAFDVAIDHPFDGPPVDAGQVDVVLPTCDGPCPCCAATCTVAMAPRPAVCAGGVDTSRFGFETSTEGWVLADTTNTVIPGRTSTTMIEAFAGRASLLVDVSVGAGGTLYARAESPPAIVAGSTVTFRVWIPTTATLVAIQPYVLDAHFTWTGSYLGLYLGQLMPGCWNIVTVHVPTTFQAPTAEVGVQILGGATAWTGPVLIDAVDW